MTPAKLINGFFDLLLTPCGGHYWPTLIVVSLLAGVLLLWLFKVTTPQQRLKRARAKLMGHLYELGLYQDDLGVLMRVQKDLFVSNLKTLVLTLPALLALIPPAVLILLQLEARLQHPAMEIGDTVLVEAVFDAPAGADDPLSTAGLDMPAGLSLDSPRVRDYAERTVWWRVKVEDEGWHEVALTEEGRTHSLTIKAADGLRRHALKRERHGWFAALGNPGADPLPGDGALKALVLHPDEPEPEWWEQGWFWWFCGISIVGGLVAKRWIKVEI